MRRRLVPLSETFEKVAAKHIPIFLLDVCSRAREVTESDLTESGAKSRNSTILIDVVEWADRIIE